MTDSHKHDLIDIIDIIGVDLKFTFLKDFPYKNHVDKNVSYQHNALH